MAHNTEKQILFLYHYMNIRCLLLIFATICFSTACESERAPSVIDCETAACVAQRALAIQEPMTAKELHDGLSGAKLFLVTAKSKTYVMRFSPSAHLDPCEIACLQIASDNGYGPHLYAIDPDQRYVIMEYVDPHPISNEDRASKQYYRALGEVVSKMHHGPNFPEHESIVTQIEHDIDQLKKYTSLTNLVTRMKKMLPVIQKAVASVSTKAPCHNDLNPTNTLYTGSSFKIIDYEAAGQDDPYYDVATVIQFNCLDPESEEELLDAYLGRPMTTKEKARLYLMKQTVRIGYTAGLILATLPEQTDEIDLGAETYEEFVQRTAERLDLPRWAFHLFKLANTSFESEEFQQAVQTVNASK